MANIQRPVFADGLSTQPYVTPAGRKTLQEVAAAAHAVPVQPTLRGGGGLFVGSSANNVNLRARNRGSSTMVVPVLPRRRNGEENAS